MLTDRAYTKLSDLERARHDRARILYLSGGIVLGTPQYNRAKLMLTQCFAENIGRNSGHSGLLISGDSTLGKTTICKTLMRHVHKDYRNQFPDFRKHGHVPVVYIEVPAGSTGKLLMRTFADFFGLTVTPSETMVSIRNRVVDTLNAAGTQLVVIDELHNLAARTAGNGESQDVLKNLHNDLAATFLYAGINIQKMLSGERSQQIGGRFAMLPMHRFNPSRDSDRRTWNGLISSFEQCLPLRHHETGTLTQLGDYLFERTNGSIGSLGRLLTGGAIEAISNPTVTNEALTQELLDIQRLDLAAETARAQRLRKNANPLSAENILEGLLA
ncbi:TniB family NTP-binding protein [Leifsonia sp. NPDC058248]|uniref:TniB family NTP-binding protein n=1 Tax=Leifsonia sp. NPDC058248 TaxID=3346402 RepID=UPI0036DEE260